MALAAYELRAVVAGTSYYVFKPYTIIHIYTGTVFILDKLQYTTTIYVLRTVLMTVCVYTLYIAARSTPAQCRHVCRFQTANMPQRTYFIDIYRLP